MCKDVRGAHYLLIDFLACRMPALRNQVPAAGVRRVCVRCAVHPRSTKLGNILRFLRSRCIILEADVGSICNAALADMCL